ncbi:hypothetical protein OCH239_09885 [Roseivivax halodurans JCM 10272]|uniref:Uncharacterized protein n=1 Tax=Roseivivax halodurans JCM 10272 TaxID=1449350 RepID=X7ECH6_9RHOB|nr:hypothetical protein [Roseivivax halodurans]ETX13580.1 hypothetical protein OCH239_09885 [Roseivivax halodurans JCM 10272]
MPSTHPHIPRLSFIFDFDLTLASDSWNAICAELGLERQEWDPGQPSSQAIERPG